MKTSWSRILITAIAVTSLSSVAVLALFDQENTQLPGNLGFDYAASARSVALGQALVADSIGTDAIYENPAGLAQYHQHQLAMLYLNLFENTYYTFMGGSHAFINGGTVALGWSQLSSQGFVGRDETQQVLTIFNDTQNSIYASYGRYLIKSDSMSLAWGTSIKTFSQYLYKYQQHALSLDLGLFATVAEGWQVGLHFQNAATVHLVTDQLQSVVPANFKAGFSYQPTTTWDYLNQLKLLAEIDIRDLYGTQGGLSNHWDNWKIGVAYQILEQISLRAGIQRNYLALGGGIHLWGVELDYAYDIRALGGLHWMSLKYNIPRYVNPAKINHHHQTALAAYQSGDYLKASQHWRQVLAMDPENSMANTYLHQSEKKRESRLQQLQSRAEEKIQISNYLEAISLLNEAARLQASNQALQERIQALKITQEKKMAKARQDKLNRHIQKAEQHEKNQQFARALDEWNLVLKLDPQQDVAKKKIVVMTDKISRQLGKYYRIGLEFFKKKNYQHAIKEFNRVLKIDKHHVLARFYLGKATDIIDKMAKEFYRKGQRYLERKNYQQAKRYFKRVLEVVPEFRDTGVKLEMISSLEKRIAPALKDFNRVQKHIANHELESAYHLLDPLVKSNNYNEVMLTSYRELKQMRLQANRLYEDGIVQHQKLAYQQAVTSLEKSMALNYEGQAKRLLVEIYAYQGIQAFRQGKIAQAIKIWKKGMVIDNEHQLIKKYIQRANNKMKFLNSMFRGAQHD